MLEALSGQPWLRPALDIARLLAFASFVALGVAVALRAERRRADRLIGFVLVLSTAVGLTQVEAWPFTNWALVHGLAPPRMSSWEIEGIDASGRAWPVDARVLQPLAPEEFGSWMFSRVPRLPDDARARVGRFLLERAEAGRQRLLEGGVVGGNELLLGPLAAPFHFQQKPVWNGAADVPRAPFVAVRVQVLEWDVEARRRDESAVARHVFLRYPS
jgi:hypothetical protein